MITKKDIWKEITPIKDVEKSEDNKFISNAIYKCCYMCVRLLIDIRTNQQTIAQKLGFKLEEPKKDVPTE